MTVRIIQGDAREVLATLPAESVHCIVTSPPYWGLRDYGEEGQLGLEPTPEEYVAKMVAVFHEARRVLRSDGTLWLNLGDSYAGSRKGPQGETGEMTDRSVAAQRRRVRPGNPDKNQGVSNRDGVHCPNGLKPKDLCMIPARVAMALQADGWWLRSDIIWNKSNPMPESVTDRPTKAHEYVFLLTKSARYWYDADAVREPLAPKTLTTFGTTRRSKGTDALGQVKAHNWARDAPERKPRLDDDGGYAGANARTVWTIATQPYPEAHFAVMAPELAKRCVLAGCPAGGVVLDMFGGAGTVGLVADRLGRDAVLVDLSGKYCGMARDRIRGDAPLFADVRDDI